MTSVSNTDYGGICAGEGFATAESDTLHDKAMRRFDDGLQAAAAGCATLAVLMLGHQGARELNRWTYGLDAGLGARRVQLRDVRRSGRGQDSPLRRLSCLDDEAIEAGRYGECQRPKCLVAASGVAVGNTEREPDERSGRRLPLVISAHAPHFPSENVERFVRRMVDMQHGGEFGRMYELHSGERVPRLATHALDERQCTQEPDRFGIVIRERVERRCG